MKRQRRLAIKNFIREAHLFRSRAVAALILAALFATILLARLAYLQISNHQFYSTLSQHNLLNVIPIEPNRGLIFDRNGVLLAKNIPTFTLTVIPSDIKNLKKTLDDLRTIIPISDHELQQFKRIRYQYRPYQPIPIKYKLTETEVAKFYVNEFRFPGVNIRTRMMRYYPLGQITSDVLGYVGRINARELHRVSSKNYSVDDDIGKVGIEKYYEKELHGVMGSEEAEIDASGRIVRILKETPPQPGQNLYLTIDSKLQAAAEKALGEKSGAIVVIQPGTGEILALVTNPSYDPNPFVSGLSQKEYQKLVHSPQHPLYNRAIRGQFAAGSTVKPFVALAALDANIVSPRYRIFDPGWFQLPNTEHIYHDWKDSGHGWVNLAKAIRVSCDVYFYNLAVAMGISRIDDVLTAFGFGHLTQVDLPEELPGLVPTPEWKLANQGHRWYTGDTIETVIGQGFMLTTPLQLAQAVAIIAERGARFKPRLLLKSIAPDGEIFNAPTIPLQPVVLNNPKNWQTVISDMEQVVTWGTGHYFGPHPGFTVAAKTGTAQVYGHQRDEDTDTTRTNIPIRLRNNHLFIAFAPIKQPKLAVAVVVEHSAMADRIAGKIMNTYFNHQAAKTTPTSKPNQEHPS